MSFQPSQRTPSGEIAINALEIAYAVARIRTGALVEEPVANELGALLEGLAATLPDLFGTVDPSCLERLSDRSGGSEGAGTFAEILVISPKHTHVIQRLAQRPGFALLAVSPASGSIGLVLTAVRNQSERLVVGS
ncbi:MAG: hypothetical protein ABI548_06360 [Polyangiaceae bacterium]